MDATVPMPDRTWTVAQLAELLQISERTVQRHTPNWPHLRLGQRCVRFTEDHITQIIATLNRHPAPPRPSRRRRTTR